MKPRLRLPADWRTEWWYYLGQLCFLAFAIAGVAMLVWLLAGCTGSDTLSMMQDKQVRQCQAAGMGVRVDFSAVTGAVTKIECVPSGLER